MALHNGGWQAFDDDYSGYFVEDDDANIVAVFQLETDADEYVNLRQQAKTAEAKLAAMRKELAASEQEAQALKDEIEYTFTRLGNPLIRTGRYRMELKYFLIANVDGTTRTVRTLTNSSFIPESEIAIPVTIKIPGEYFVDGKCMVTVTVDKPLIQQEVRRER